MSGQQIPALAIQQVNDVLPGTVPRIPRGGLALYSNADGSASFWDTAAAGGLPGEFFIDPTIAADNAPRFKTIQAAVNYANTNLLTIGTFSLAPGSIYLGNVTMPAAGFWQIICASDVKPTIQGNIICDNAGGAAYNFSRVAIVGNLTGAKSGSATSVIRLFNVSHTGNQTLSVSGTGVWQSDHGGLGGNFNGASGFSSAGNTVSVVGRIIANNWSFLGNVTYTDRGRFNSVVIGANVTITANGNGAETVMLSCQFAGATSFVGVGLPSLRVDGATLATMGLSTGQTVVTGVVMQTLSANGVIETLTAVANISNQFLMAGPAGMYTVRALANLTVSGGTGTFLIDVNYIDQQGVSRTLAVTTTGLVLSGTVGTEDAGVTRPFYHNGASPITVTFKGLVSAGASARVIVACRREN